MTRLRSASIFLSPEVATARGSAMVMRTPASLPGWHRRVHPTVFLRCWSPHRPAVFALAAAHLIIATGNSATGHDRCFHRCMLLLPSFLQSSLVALPQLFLMLPWLPSSPFHCSACFANTGCCCRNSGSCDGASWVRAPGVPRPHSRGLLHLLDLLH